MNFKIESRILSIQNYPSVARHFEEMASKGWMIDRVILEHILIYKKIKPQELEFSIVPFQNESFFNRKTKEDISEYKNKNKEKGLDYAGRTSFLHIYYKEKAAQSTDIISDEREEFKIIEKASKFINFGNYLIFPLYLFLYTFIFKDIKTDIYIMKSAISQLLLIFMPFYLLMSVSNIISIKLFIKRNRANVYNRDKIEYSTSKFYFQKIIYIMGYIFTILLLSYLLYMFIVLKDKSTFVSIIPVSIGILVGTGFRFFVKPSKKLGDYKEIVFILVFIAAMILISIVVLPRMEDSLYSKVDVDRDKFKVMHIDDFYDGVETASVELSQDVSILIPRSYRYTAMDERTIYITSDYSKALNEDIAHELVNRYKINTEKEIDDWYDYSLEDYYYSGDIDTLGRKGISREELDSLKDENIDIFKSKAKDIMKERNIVEIDKALWNVDEGYYLDYEKDSIILRKAHEVWTLAGIDFSDEEIRKIVREKLRLN